MKIKKPSPKYVAGQQIIFGGKTYKVGKPQWDNEIGNWRYFAYPLAFPLFEFEINKENSDLQKV